MKNKAGVLGLGVMGKSLAMNLMSNEYPISVFDINQKAVQSFSDEKGCYGAESIKDFVLSLKHPRKIFIIITAGPAVDEVINNLIPYLEGEDCIIECGNSYYLDSNQREALCQSKGINFISLGVSGGEQGALLGPSLMPSGTIEAYEMVKDVLIDISAKTADGDYCAKYLGPAGSGHFIKMVHNGIEYGDLQLIAESYGVMRDLLGMKNEAISDTFRLWNTGILEAYLLDLTDDVLRKQDPEAEGYLLDKISDVTRQKGTGSWTIRESLTLSGYVPSLYHSVGIRFASEKQVLRNAMSQLYPNEVKECGDKWLCLEYLRDAYTFARLSIYAQGFEVLDKASKSYEWKLNMQDIADNWREGCIIKGKLIEVLASIDQKDKQSILLDPAIKEILDQCKTGMKKTLQYAMDNDYPLPVMTDSLQYVNVLSQKRLSTNIIQSLRDCFGGHNVERTDRSGSVHYDWIEE